MTNNQPLLAFSIIFVAGILSGSYALPIKYIKNWRFENIWLSFSLWTFAIFPYFITKFLVPQLEAIYLATPTLILSSVLTGGFVFGLGQVCFVLALERIGFGLGFLINVGLGMALGFLLPMLAQYRHEIFTPFGLTTFSGTILAVIGLIFAGYAGKLREQTKNQATVKQQYKNNTHVVGIVLASLAGLFSAGQNLTFSLTEPMQQLALNMGASNLGADNIIWPGFLFCSFLPYATYMLFLQYKNKSFALYINQKSLKYFLTTCLMGLGWFIPTMCYGKASQLFGNIGPIVAWPTFMIMIILVANFWGWQHKEWEGVSKKASKFMQISLMFLIGAALIIGYSAKLHVS
ncbi:MAG: L-rhamnose/proton symporter RhaT [Gammaproteobacteria bacterium]